MIRIFKALGLTFVAVCALGAVMASGASAAEFTAFNTTTAQHEGGTSTGTDLSTPVFTVTGNALQVRCSKNSYTGSSATGTEPTPKVKPVYEECGAFLFGFKVGGATVNPNGCEYQFHITAEKAADEWTGTSSIVCSGTATGFSITTTNGCTIEVPAEKNQAVNGNTYKNTTEKSPTDVDVVVNATNVHSITSGGESACGTANGEHATGTMVSNVTTKAFNNEGKQIDLTVM